METKITTKHTRLYLKFAKQVTDASGSHDILQAYLSHSAISITRELQKNPIEMCPRCKVERSENNQLKQEVPKVEKGALRRDKMIKKLRKLKKPNSKKVALLKKLVDRKNGYTKITCTICGYWIKKPPVRLKPPSTTEEPATTQPQKSQPKPVLHNLFPLGQKQPTKTKQGKSKSQGKNLKATTPKLKAKKLSSTPQPKSSNSLLDFLKTIKK